MWVWLVAIFFLFLFLVSPVTTHSLLRQLSVKPDIRSTAGGSVPTTPTPQPAPLSVQTPPTGTSPETIEMSTIQPSFHHQGSEPAMSSMATSERTRPPLDRSISVPVSSTLKVSASSTPQRKPYLSRPTGRLQADPEELQTIEPKPDLWKIAKIALTSISYLTQVTYFWSIFFLVPPSFLSFIPLFFFLPQSFKVLLMTCAFICHF